jgi:hypothetical protein
VLGHALSSLCTWLWTNKKARRTRKSYGLQRPAERHDGAATTCGQCCAPAGRLQPRRPVFRRCQVRCDLTDGETTGNVESAMTTAALTRDSASAELFGLAGVFAVIIFVVVLILPL